MFDRLQGADRHGNLSKCPLLSMPEEEPGAVPGGFFLAIDSTADSQQKQIRNFPSCIPSHALIQGKPCSRPKYTTRIIMDTYGKNG